jgi:indole-3-glycerol phosphate synthase
LGLDVLVEVHDEGELDRALAAGATLVGVNNRNLRTLAVDVDASFRLAARLPKDVLAVAESGLRKRDDLERLAEAGYKAFLIGERLMTTADPGAALAALLDGGAAA